MLVLRRKTNESVVLNGVIKITVLSVEGDRVKLGIDAPPDVIVVREELLDQSGNASQSEGGGGYEGRRQQHVIEAPRPNAADWGKPVISTRPPTRR